MSRDTRVRAEDAHGWSGPVSVAQRGMVCRPARGPVTHDYVALAYYTAGTATMEQRGAWSLRPGDMLLVPAGEPHRLVTASDVEFWGLGFCPVCFVADGSEGLLEPFERVRYGASAVVTIPEGRRAFLESLFRELKREVEGGGQAAGGLAVQKSLITLIVAEASRAACWKAQEGAGNGVVADALGFIERRCLEPISLRDVASAVGRSPAYLTTAVKRATGRSVQAWIIAGRLSEARRRLVHSDESVDVIAERVGYADATHFIRMFRRAHGVTPAAWRASRRGDAAKP